MPAINNKKQNLMKKLRKKNRAENRHLTTKAARKKVAASRNRVV